MSSPVVGYLSELGVSSRSHRLFSISLALGLSLGYLSLVGTCWEHHYLTRLTPPTPCSVMELKRMIFFLLRLSSWQELNVGESAGMLQRFCRARDDPQPPPPSPVFLLLLLLISFSLEWCHSLRERLSLPRWLCVPWAILVLHRRGQRAAVAEHRHQWDQWVMKWARWRDSRVLCHDLIWIIHFPCGNNAPRAD